MSCSLDRVLLGLCALLLGNTDSATMAARRLCMLATDFDAPVVTETTMSADLLQALEIFTELVFQTVRQNLSIFAITIVLLTVEEPVRDLVLPRVLDDGHDALDFFFRELTRALAEVDIGLLADEVGKAATNTFDGGQSVHDFLATINVRVEHTQDMLKAVGKNERHDGFVS